MAKRIKRSVNSRCEICGKKLKYCQGHKQYKKIWQLGLVVLFAIGLFGVAYFLINMGSQNINLDEVSTSISLQQQVEESIDVSLGFWETKLSVIFQEIFVKTQYSVSSINEDISMFKEIAFNRLGGDIKIEISVVRDVSDPNKQFMVNWPQDESLDPSIRIFLPPLEELYSYLRSRYSDDLFIELYKAQVAIGLHHEINHLANGPRPSLVFTRDEFLNEEIRVMRRSCERAISPLLARGLVIDPNHVSCYKAWVLDSMNPGSFDTEVKRIYKDSVFVVYGE